MDTSMDGVTLLDDDGLRALADPEAFDTLVAQGGDLSLRAGGLPALREARQRHKETLPAVAVPDGVTVGELAADGARPPVHLLEPSAGPSTDAVVLYLHGGGYVFGTVEDADPGCGDIALAHGCRVVNVDYRLAPEHPFPAGLDDCEAALDWVLDDADGLGLDPSQVIIEGPSAGAGLTIALGLRARDRGFDVAGLVAPYPMLDDRVGRASVERMRSTRMWHRDLNAQAWDAYLDGMADSPDGVPVDAAPGRATIDQLRGLAPVFLEVGTLDIFLDEDVAFARALALAGVLVELVVVPGAFHASEGYAPQSPASVQLRAARTAARARFLATT